MVVQAAGDRSRYLALHTADLGAYEFVEHLGERSAQEVCVVLGQQGAPDLTQVYVPGRHRVRRSVTLFARAICSNPMTSSTFRAGLPRRAAVIYRWWDLTPMTVGGQRIRLVHGVGGRYASVFHLADGELAGL